MRELSRNERVVILSAILAALLLACNGGEADSSQAKATGTLAGTVTPSFTPTPTPTETPTSTVMPTVDVSGCRLGAAFVKDVTIPDGTRMKPGSTFTKTWELRNTGTCTWIQGFRLAHVASDRMGAPHSVEVPEASPGQVVEVSVRMVVPGEPGAYHSDWRMCVNDQFFGTALFVQVISQVTPTPTKTPHPSRTPRPIADISFFTIRNNLNAMTDAQWKVYRRSLIGKCVRWTGWVDDSRESGRLCVDMDPPEDPFSVFDVSFRIPRGDVLKYNLNQRITFEGDISMIIAILGSVDITLDDVTVR